ncbi:MAG: hypothetical protein V7L20_13305 [Nostoc sp.]|uniref:hypothetical protein n=1 Tax=Nostoc sp. TaxID=1180 RepID=UPI002FFD5221
MSQLLTLKLSDDVYATLQQQADAVGLSVAELISIKRTIALIILQNKASMTYS